MTSRSYESTSPTCYANLVSALLSNNGEDALELAKHEDVSAVVSDVAMPGAIDGVELACRLKGDSPSTGVILLSGVANPADHQLPRGVRFLPKPIKATTLLRLLREVAGLRTTPPA